MPVTRTLRSNPFRRCFQHASCPHALIVTLVLGWFIAPYALGQQAASSGAEAAEDHDHDHEGHDHAGHDHAHDHAPPPAPTASQEDVERLAKSAEGLLSDFLEDLSAGLSADALGGVSAQLRELTGRVDEWLSVRESNPATRIGARKVLHANLVGGLAAALTRTGTAQARADQLAQRAMETADEAVRWRRKKHVVDHLMCWCPKPACNFTRTLAGCPDPCANEQKGMVAAWIREGLTDDEIFQRMVDHPKGDPKVLTTPRVEGAQSFGFFVPIALAVAGAAAVLSLLLRSVRRGKVQAASEFVSTEDGQDDRWGDAIERELKELDS